MEARTTANKPAPVKMVHFIAELLQDLPIKGRVVSVEVEDTAYLVTLALAGRGLSVHQLSVWDVSRSMRGDPNALASIRADLLRGA
ncbi:MAG: hypothetical protein AUH29_05010 [Candidatus Rokubacteria bacterium 13_1_40CM_69_27]|nr:MAG: hypothetical protein AUH29_05010 [Candidatus Rokubacteria bacterium 13_1_40CM_69_27]OLC33407.1 MAG: hypothetical protein AUH81_14305 [Candidatus Rokubacteria bacterium 13_1_40CM_4_69_5]OLE37029.1 MAG: hypothetical protein AUG00_09325 [Candidatus Rokubacteria bacterium 13_1_20CM_2_70_7]